MGIYSSYSTNTGVKKPVNQDALCILDADWKGQDVCLAVICDGMGGLRDGEVASASCINALTQWFENEFPAILQKGQMDDILGAFREKIQRLNKALMNYGNEHHCQTGSTLTALLLFEGGDYFLAHVGDSRAYEFSDSGIEQLSMDQSYVAREIRRGHMTPEQAKHDPRKNVLLQCIGVNNSVEPELKTGKFIPGASFLLCSDGFRHEVHENEMMSVLAAVDYKSEQAVKSAIDSLIDLNIKRGETDNITALYVKTESV